jgi:hypothetical protein
VDSRSWDLARRKKTLSQKCSNLSESK